MRILITGGAGSVSASLASSFKEQGPAAIAFVLDDLERIVTPTAGDESSLEESISWFAGIPERY